MKLSTQKAAILQHLKQHHGITALEALKRYGIFRLASRVYDLKWDGHPVQSRFVTVASCPSLTLEQLRLFVTIRQTDLSVWRVATTRLQIHPWSRSKFRLN